MYIYTHTHTHTYKGAIVLLKLNMYVCLFPYAVCFRRCPCKSQIHSLDDWGEGRKFSSDEGGLDLCQLGYHSSWDDPMIRENNKSWWLIRHMQYIVIVCILYVIHMYILCTLYVYHMYMIDCVEESWMFDHWNLEESDMLLLGKISKIISR